APSGEPRRVPPRAPGLSPRDDGRPPAERAPLLGLSDRGPRLAARAGGGARLERPAPPVQPGRHASGDVPAPHRALRGGRAAGCAAPRRDEGAGRVSAVRPPWTS